MYPSECVVWGRGGGGGGPKTKWSVFKYSRLKNRDLEVIGRLLRLKIWSESLVETRQCFNTTDVF